MIHYHHITGLGPNDTHMFLLGKHGLISYMYQKYMDIAMSSCQSVVLDNGAFTIWKQGGELDVSGYIKWVEKWYKHPALDWVLIPDVIDGNESENDALLRDWPEGFTRAVPVWHMHESFDRLGRLCDEYERVALGSSGAWSKPNTNAWWDRMGQAMDAICDSEGRPPCKLHGLRMLDPAVFTRLPLSSADSINAVRNCNQLSRFGINPAPFAGGRARTTADRIEADNSAPRWQRIDQGDLFARAA